MRKKVLAFIVLAMIVAMTCACGSTTKKKSIVDKIGIDKYDWGTTVDTITKGEIKKGMVEGEDYVYFYEGSEIAEELVIDKKIGGKEYRKYYDFDENGELVSVMLILNTVLTNEETVDVFIELAEAYKKAYGEPTEVYNEYSTEVYRDIGEYANDLVNGDIISSYTWFDEEGNQLLLYAAQGEGYIDVILAYSSSEYNL